VQLLWVVVQWLFRYIQTAPIGKSDKDMATTKKQRWINPRYVPGGEDEASYTEPGYFEEYEVPYLKSDEFLPKTQSSWTGGYHTGREWVDREWNADNTSAFSTPQEEEAAIAAENAAYQKAFDAEMLERFKPDTSHWASQYIVPGSVRFTGFETKPTGRYERVKDPEGGWYLEPTFEEDRTRPTYEANFDANGTKFTGNIGPDGKFQRGSTNVTKGDYLQYVNADGSTTWERYRDMGGGELGVLLSVASFIPGIGPFAAAANAALNLSQGNTTGAILSGLGAYGGFAGQELSALKAAEASGDIINASRALDLADTVSNAKLASTAISGVNALAIGNEIGAINAALSGAGQMGVELPSGVTTGVQSANLAAAISSGDTAGALKALGDLSGSSDVKTAAAAVKLADVLQSDNLNPQAIVNAATGLYGHVSKGTPADIRLAPPVGPVPSLEEILSQPPVESAPSEAPPVNNLAPEEILSQPAAEEPVPVDDPTLEEILSQPVEPEVTPAPVEPAPVEPSPVDDPTLEEILSLPVEPAPVEPEPAPIEPEAPVYDFGEPEQEPTLEEILSQPTEPSPVDNPTLEEILSLPAEPAPVELETTPEPSPVDDPTLEEILSQPTEPSPVDDPTLEEMLGQPEPSPVDDPTLEEILSQPEPAPVEPPDDSRPDEEEPGSKGPTDEDTARRFKEEYDRYLAYMEAGEPPPPEYGIQDMGITDESWDSYTQQMLDMDARGELPSQWRPEADGSFTYTDDDGSTITIDESGDIIDFTEAPSGMLPGEEPALVTPAPVAPGTPALVKPTTPSTPTTPTAPTTPANPTTPAIPATPKTDAPSTQNLVALLALLGSGGGGSSAPPTQVAPAEVQLMEEIFGSNLFSKDPGGISAADAKAGKRNFNNGGSVDELLHLLRG
jgi:hypothetical protein